MLKLIVVFIIWWQVLTEGSSCQTVSWTDLRSLSTWLEKSLESMWLLLWNSFNSFSQSNYSTFLLKFWFFFCLTCLCVSMQLRLWSFWSKQEARRLCQVCLNLTTYTDTYIHTHIYIRLYKHAYINDLNTLLISLFSLINDFGLYISRSKNIVIKFLNFRNFLYHCILGLFFADVSVNNELSSHDDNVYFWKIWFFFFFLGFSNFFF